MIQSTISRVQSQVINQFASPLATFTRLFAASSPIDFNTCYVGKSMSISKQFTQHEVQAFASLTGDLNPIHLSHTAATDANLPCVITPGIFSASLFPTIISQQFPGAIYLSQSLKFKKYIPVRIYNTLT